MCAHTFAQSTPGETFLQGSHQSVLWLSLGKFPPLQSTAPTTTTNTSTIFPSVSVFGSHLRTIHSSQLTSSTPHPPFPIASHRGIIGANWGAGSLPRRYQIRLLQLDFRRALNLSVGYNKPGRGGKKLPPAKFCVKFAREGRKTGKWDTSVKQINRIRPPPPPIIPSKVCGMVNNNDAFTCPGHNSSNLDQRKTNLNSFLNRK